MKYIIEENRKIKKLISEDYNYYFNKETGYFERWGKTLLEDPDFSEFGPEIADIEITTKCSGPGGKLCPFCYKGNTPSGSNMSFDTFKKIFHKLPKTLTQIAFGADATATMNPDIWKIMSYCRNNDYNYVVPNITVADVSDEVAKNLEKYCGAVAVSRYSDKDICYDSVKKLTDLGMTQVNIHLMVSEETYMDAIETLSDIKTDSRLSKLNAIVFLSLKNKGRGKNFQSLSQEDFKKIVDFAMKLEVPFGFDSCSCQKFLESVKDHSDFKKFEMMAEPCESTRFSIYIDVHGNYYPCSFSEGIGKWKNGISVIDSKNFLEDIWNSKNTQEFRIKCINNITDKNSCQLYSI